MNFPKHTVIIIDMSTTNRELAPNTASNEWNMAYESLTIAFDGVMRKGSPDDIRAMARHIMMLADLTEEVQKLRDERARLLKERDNKPAPDVYVSASEMHHLICERLDNYDDTPSIVDIAVEMDVLSEDKDEIFDNRYVSRRLCDEEQELYEFVYNVRYLDEFVWCAEDLIECLRHGIA